MKKILSLALIFSIIYIPSPASAATIPPIGERFMDSTGIVWRTIAEQGNHRLIITEHVHGYGTAYHSTYTYTRLNNAAILRPALNAFWENNISPELRAKIVPANGMNNDIRHQPGGDWHHGTPNDADRENEAVARTSPSSGTATPDNSIFILSISEVNEYFGQPPAGYWTYYTRIAYDTAGTPQFWWLRSPGGFVAGPVAIVGSGGEIACIYANHTTIGYRPAIWVDAVGTPITPPTNTPIPTPTNTPIPTPTNTPIPTPTRTPLPTPTNTPIPTPTNTPIPTPTNTPIPPPQPTPAPLPILPMSTTNHAYLLGYDDGRIHPENHLTRAEVATVFFRTISDEHRVAVWATHNNFNDVHAESWYNNAISTMANAGVIRGRSDGTFAPHNAITRAEFAAIISRFVNATATPPSMFNDIAGHWAEQAINLAGQNGWILGDGDGNFRPDDTLIRAEAAAVVNRLRNCRVSSKSDLLEGMRTWADNSDESMWYYLDIQQATNTVGYERKPDGTIRWTELWPFFDFTILERPNARAEDIFPARAIWEEQMRNR